MSTRALGKDDVQDRDDSIDVRGDASEAEVEHRFGVCTEIERMREVERGTDGARIFPDGFSKARARTFRAHIGMR